MTSRDTPPAHVLAAFGVPAGADPETLSGRRGVLRFGPVVLKPVSRPAEASWMAGLLDTLHVDGVRIARPVRSSDGRWVVGGWTAHRWVTGRPEHRHDEIIRTSLLLHEATAGVGKPRFLAGRDDLYSWADRLAWGEATDEAAWLGDGHSARMFAELAEGCRDVGTTAQLVHGDLFDSMLFAGTAPPAVIDFTPYWRPAVWAAAVVAVDALARGGAPVESVGQWEHLPHWRQMLRRALMFRLAISLVHPRTAPESMVALLAVAQLLQAELD